MRLGQAKKIGESIMAHNIKLASTEGASLNNKVLIPMLEGDPGLGKTSIVAAIAKALGMRLIVVRLSDREPTDVTGWHVPNEDNTAMRHVRPDWLPHEDDPLTCVFFDEIAQGATAAQNTVGQAFNERMVGGYKVHPNTFFIGAGNGTKARAGTNHMPTHVRDRMLWLEVEADVRDTVPYFTSIGVPSIVCAYLSFRSEMLSKFDRDAKACPSPRSWERVGEIIQTDLPMDLMTLAVAGQVGEGAAKDFTGFMRMKADEVPDMDKLLANPDTAPVPSDLGVLYAVAMELAARFNKDTCDAVCTYLRRIPKQDIAAATVANIVRKEGRGIIELPEMRKLMAEFGQQITG